MAIETEKYKRSFTGSVGAGMGSLFNASGKTYYILEHKVTSRYHKAGESQKIIIDQIELGRDPSCQVRFDETFGTVSRKHAAIVKDGENWKLVQLSKTNTTFLNGRPVQTEWYLQSGDEIQLSVNGPKMGFIIPQGKKSLVSSINFTERLGLFRQQALKPYKMAITMLSIVLLLAVGGLVTWNVLQKADFDNAIADQKTKFEKLLKGNQELEKLIAEGEKEQKRLDSIIKHRPKQVIVQAPPTVEKLLEVCKDDVYFIYTTKVVLTNGQEEEVIPEYGWTGTGFLLNDGRFVTARHCVEGWRFSPNKYYLMAYNTPGVEIVAYIEAYSRKGDVLSFKSSDFRCTHSMDVEKVTENGLKYAIAYPNSSDWAYINCGKKGRISADTSLSSGLSMGAELHVLGFPLGMGATDTRSFSCLYGSCKTAVDGLDDGIIRVSARNYESGNSGGPVFYSTGSQLKVVGIVSYTRLNERTGEKTNYGGIVPVSALK